MAGRDKDLAKVLAIVNRKGGVAKTTTAINLAHGLSRKLLRRVDASQVGQIQESMGEAPGEDRLFQYEDYYEWRQVKQKPYRPRLPAQPSTSRTFARG